METPIVGLNLHGFTRNMAYEAVDRVLSHLLHPATASPREHVHGGMSREKISRDTTLSSAPLPDLPILTGFRGPEYVVGGAWLTVSLCTDQ